METGSRRMFSKKLNVYVIKSEMLIQDGDRQFTVVECFLKGETCTL